jgi:hypothetical protein
VADRDLKLNSLSRYSKESPLLILEEHGHCEVPAGCGGVVLRWRDPRAGVPLVMRMYVEGEGTLLLDGQSPPAARSIVPLGEHVLGLVVSGFDPEYLVLMFTAADEPPTRSRPAHGAAFRLATAADGTWRYTVDRPAGEDWLHPGFDDGDWLDMEARPGRRPPEDPDRDYARYRVDMLADAGAVGLGVTHDAPRVWIRREFTL